MLNAHRLLSLVQLLLMNRPLLLLPERLQWNPHPMVGAHSACAATMRLGGAMLIQLLLSPHTRLHVSRHLLTVGGLGSR